MSRAGTALAANRQGSCRDVRCKRNSVSGPPNTSKTALENNGKEVATGVRRNGSQKSLASDRAVRVPAKVITKEEYKGYQECTQAPVKIVQEASIIAAETEKERLMKESTARKEEFRRLDKIRLKEHDTRVNEIEEEARKRTMYVLERAHNMRLEQEEEIQKCNRIILATKCRAIRDAQVNNTLFEKRSLKEDVAIAEKKLIEKELKDEEKRLNDMMENERRWALKGELKKEQEEAAKREKFASILKDQILENEVQKILEFERKREESRLLNLSNIAWQQEEIARLRNKESENARIRQMLTEGNEQLRHFKRMEQEENRIIDLRIKEYQRLKEEREKKLAEERRLEKLKKEQERQHLASRAVQAQDLQAHIDEVNAARIQEEVERLWRQKEKAEAVKRIEARKKLAKDREEQINNKKILQTMEIEREKCEFEKIVRVQKDAFIREKAKLEKKQRDALLHRTEILKQVNERERERIEGRQKMFEEGLAIRTEAEMRKKKLQEAMQRKCEEMRDNRVPEVYVKEVKRLIENV